MKKVISSVLAVLMLFSICSVACGAAVSEGTHAAVRIKPVSTVDGVVTFEVSYELGTIGEMGLLGPFSSFSVAWDSDVFEMVETIDGIVKLDSSTTMVFDGYPISDIVVPSNSNIRTTGAESLSAADTAKGWDTGFYVSITSLDGNSTIYDDYSTEKAAFAFKLKLKDGAAAGKHSVGVTDWSINNGKFCILEYTDAYGVTPYETLDPSSFGLSGTKLFEFYDAEYEVAAAAAPTLTHVKTMGQMKNWNDTTATKFNAGLVGCLANYTPVADGNEITSIDYIMVEVTRGTETLTGYAHQLYLQDDGSYWFRAVINNADIADTENLSFKYTIVFTDGTEPLTYESTAEDVTSFNGIYTTANNNRLGN